MKTQEISGEALRKLQYIELEMLIEVDRICRKHAIEYSLDGGTLLGAVRHKGFIPWDDDIDVVMLRPQYERFRATCQTELDVARFFLQDETTDPYYRWGYAKLRRNGTVFVRVGQEHSKARGGIFIDIFIYDHVPDGYWARRLHLFACYLVRKILYAEIGRRNASNVFLRGWYSFLYNIPRGYAFRIRDGLAAWGNASVTELCRHLTYPYKRSRYGLPRKCFDSYKEIEFEGLIFRAFSDADVYLSALYGDYMQLPPIEKRRPHLEVTKIKFVEPALPLVCAMKERNENL